MRFLEPGQLGWLALAAIPLALYLLRRRPVVLPVTTLPFFAALSQQHRESSWLRRIKRLLSLLLTLLVVVLGCLGLGRLVMAPPEASLQRVVILLDGSASMLARQGDGTPAFEQLRGQVVQRLEALPDGVTVAVMVYDRQVRVLEPPTLDRRAALRAVEAASPRPIAGDLAVAMPLAEAVAKLQTPAAIWHVTDGTSGAAAGGLAAGVALETLAPPPDEPPVNVGITAFDLRRLPLQQGALEAFVEVQASAGAAGSDAEAELHIYLDDQLVSLRQLAFDPASDDGHRQRLIVPVTAGAGAVLRLAVVAPGDVLAADDEVVARVPPVDPVRVLWVVAEPDPFTQLALAALTDEQFVTVFEVHPDQYPVAEAVDVVIFDHWLPPAWPEDVPAVVLSPQPGGEADSEEAAAARVGPVAMRMLGAPVAAGRLRVPNPGHAVLYGVASDRLSASQSAVLALQGGLEPLWLGAAGPVLAAGEHRGQRVVIAAIEAAVSAHLPLTASYPLLLGNAVYWCAEPGRRRQADQVRPTGEVVAIPPGADVTWRSGGGEDVRPAARAAGAEAWLTLDRVGLWDAGEGARGSAAVLAAVETRMAGTDEAADAGAVRSAEGSGGDLTPQLLWAAVGILLLESYLFHRRGVS